MTQRIKNIVIIGGGTAGWMTAGLLAARHPDRSPVGISITVIESPDIPTVGVGEGTWPTIRKTLSRIGIKEEDFLRRCDASFKQGSRFDGWVNGDASDSYHHPFELPVSRNANELLHAWKTYAPDMCFAEAVCVQSSPSQDGLAPRQKSMPEYFGAMNYAYHLDAVKMSTVLRDHAVQALGVVYISDHVTKVIGDRDDDIEGVLTRNHGQVLGDLFIDCTGQKSLLLGGHYGVDFIDQSHILFNNRALVTRLPVAADAPITSQTISTAHEAGWIWDIGLPTRRGIGCVYASDYMSDTRAEEVLFNYVGSTDYETRKLSFTSGHREHFWHRNCLAIGLSAGFLEPLEASAIVLVELSADMLADNLPVTRADMDIDARKFNDIFKYRWARIIDFLKLHYVLSKREDPYWMDNRDAHSIPQRLQEYLEMWKHRPPVQSDFEHASEIFPASSYHFVLYGMGFPAAAHPTLKPVLQDALKQKMGAMMQKQKKFAAGLPTNRALLAGLQKASTQ